MSLTPLRISDSIDNLAAVVAATRQAPCTVPPHEVERTALVAAYRRTAEAQARPALDFDKVAAHMGQGRTVAPGLSETEAGVATAGGEVYADWVVGMDMLAPGWSSRSQAVQRHGSGAAFEDTLGWVGERTSVENGRGGGAVAAGQSMARTAPPQGATRRLAPPLCSQPAFAAALAAGAAPCRLVLVLPPACGPPLPSVAAPPAPPAAPARAVPVLPDLVPPGRPSARPAPRCAAALQ